MSDAYEIRQAGPGDARAIRALTREAYAKWVPLIGREPLPMSADYEEALKSHRFDLLFDAGELIALIETIPHPDHLLIENVAVSPARQGEGLGRLLIDGVERLAVALGHAEIRLYTNKLFAANLTFYDKLGYRVAHEEEYRGGVVVHMAKALSEPDPVS